MTRRNGHTLAELVVVVLIVSVLTCIAVPRLPFSALSRARAETTARKIVLDLRLVRAWAVLNAPHNPAGYALRMTGSEPYRGYQLVNCDDSAVIAEHELPVGICCRGGRYFRFSPLGHLRQGSDTELRVSSQRGMLTITVSPATGMVRWM